VPAGAPAPSGTRLRHHRARDVPLAASRRRPRSQRGAWRRPRRIRRIAAASGELDAVREPFAPERELERVSGSPRSASHRRGAPRCAAGPTGALAAERLAPARRASLRCSADRAHVRRHLRNSADAPRPVTESLSTGRADRGAAPRCCSSPRAARRGVPVTDARNTTHCERRACPAREPQRALTPPVAQRFAPGHTAPDRHPRRRRTARRGGARAGSRPGRSGRSPVRTRAASS
jgi:hypothetical protein